MTGIHISCANGERTKHQTRTITVVPGNGRKVGEQMREWICSVMEPLNREWKFIAKQELVRCRNCRNAVIYDDNEVVCAHIDSNGNDKHPADWFCADGERKETI